MSYYNTKQASEMPSAEKLAEELNKCVELQETMKAVNAYWRKHQDLSPLKEANG